MPMILHDDGWAHWEPGPEDASSTDRDSSRWTMVPVDGAGARLELARAWHSDDNADEDVWIERSTWWFDDAPPGTPSWVIEFAWWLILAHDGVSVSPTLPNEVSTEISDLALAAMLSGDDPNYALLMQLNQALTFIGLDITQIEFAADPARVRIRPEVWS